MASERTAGPFRRRLDGEGLVLAAAYATRAYELARYLNRPNAVILTYHGFTDRRSHEGIENHERKHIFVNDLRSQILFVKQHHHIISLEELVRARATNAPLPERAAVITIDDGYRSTYTVAFPVLCELEVPAAVFLATEYVDERRFLWTDRVEYAVNHAPPGTVQLTAGGKTLRLQVTDISSRMAADQRIRSTLKSLPQAIRDTAVEDLERTAGSSLGSSTEAAEMYEPLRWSDIAEMVHSGLLSVGSHTHTHAILSRCSRERATHELRVSKHIIEDRLGVPCRLFCYPNGRRGDFNRSTAQLVSDCGYCCALTTVYGMNGAGTDLYELRRYNLSKDLMPGELEVRLSGFMDLPSIIRHSVLGAFRRKTSPA